MSYIGKIESFSGKYRFLSNFYPCFIEYEGITYPSTEHAFQAAKFLDFKIREEIAALKKPMEAKLFPKGKTIRDDWFDVSLKIMKDVNVVKYRQPSFRDRLDDTRGYKLEEGNTWGDTFWGTCNGTGENHLGKILMEIRDEL